LSSHLLVLFMRGFTKLVEHNILSAPVWDEKEKKYTGFLDVRDLVSFVVFIDDDQKSGTPNDLEQILKHGLKLFKVPVDGVTCTYLSRRNPIHSVKPTDNLLTVARLLAKGIHRVAVVNESGQIINIVSQSSLVGLFHTRRHELSPDNHARIEEIKIGTSPVISVLSHTKAVDVFRLMDNKKLSGVAVVDQHDVLVGNTSSSDLKLFLRNPSMSLLNLTIAQFLNKIRVENERVPVLAISRKHTLEYLIEKMISTQVHRLFVADDSNQYIPESVISISDLLKYVAT